MKTAATVTQCPIANKNILQFYGRLCSLLYWKCLQNTSKGHWKVKIISLAAEGT